MIDSSKTLSLPPLSPLLPQRLPGNVSKASPFSFSFASPLPCRAVPFVDDLRICVTGRLDWEGSARFPPFNRPRHVRRLFFPPLTRAPWQRTGPLDRSASSLPNWIFKSRSTRTSSFFFPFFSKTCHAIFTKGGCPSVCRRFSPFLFSFYNSTEIKPTKITYTRFFRILS